jgi:hypothetical protein
MRRHDSAVRVEIRVVDVLGPVVPAFAHTQTQRVRQSGAPGFGAPGRPQLNLPDRGQV